MTVRHLCLALLVALFWGANFSFMKIGLKGNSPLVFAALRSIFVLPFLFFIPRPKMSWKTLVIIGVLIGTIKLPLVLLGIHFGIAAGLSSLVIQVQAFFTILLALILFNQKPTIINWIGMSIAFLGIGLISVSVEGESSLVGFLLVVASALFWAISNLIIQKKCQNVDMLSLMAWMNIIPPIPLLILSCFIYGVDDCIYSLQNLTWISISALCYASVCAGLIGYTLWGVLLKKYPATIIAPFSLLIPVFAITIAYFTLDEKLTQTDIYGCILVVIGIIINQIKITGFKLK